MSYFGNDSQRESSTLNSAAENIIIQCEHCTTTYGVPPQAFGQTGTAKFHCFSCDEIFVSTHIESSREEPEKEDSNRASLSPLQSKIEISRPTPPQVSSGPGQEPDAQSKVSFINQRLLFAEQENSSYGFNSDLKIKAASANFSLPSATDRAPVAKASFNFDGAKNLISKFQTKVEEASKNQRSARHLFAKSQSDSKKHDEFSPAVSSAVTQQRFIAPVQAQQSGLSVRNYGNRFVFNQTEESENKQEAKEAGERRAPGARLAMVRQNLLRKTSSVSSLFSMGAERAGRQLSQVKDLAVDYRQFSSDCAQRIGTNSRKSVRQGVSFGLTSAVRSIRLAFFIIPIVLILIGMYLFSNYVAQKPEKFSSVIESISEPVAGVSLLDGQLAAALPAGVGVRNIEHRFFTNQQSEKFSIIRGEVFNNSKQTVGAPQLEAAVFDSNGKITKRVVSGNSLNLNQKELLQPLTLQQTILAQASSPVLRKKTLIAANQSKPFSVVLPLQAKAQAAFFTSRVFSVS